MAGFFDYSRPLVPGESRENPDKSHSTEISITVTHPLLNRGKPTLIPSLWKIGDQFIELPEEQAIGKALQSGLQFPSFSSLEEADKYARYRSMAGGAQYGPLGKGDFLGFFD